MGHKNKNSLFVPLSDMKECERKNHEAIQEINRLNKLISEYESEKKRRESAYDKQTDTLGIMFKIFDRCIRELRSVENDIKISRTVRADLRDFYLDSCESAVSQICGRIEMLMKDLVDKHWIDLPDDESIIDWFNEYKKRYTCIPIDRIRDNEEARR